MAHYIDHPLIKSDSIEARLYQQVLAADVLKKGNTMIVAPTALGKTIVATLVAADRLDKVKNSKILVLAPSKPLAIQHESTFKEFLTVPCSSITGAVKTDERVKRWEESQIICATPQTVESDLLKGRYSLKDVSLVVFDECHHGVGSYSYVYLASRYVKESKFNLILGLTASPGSDKEKIKEALTKASEIADIILINAGSSKGTKDFTLDLLETEGEVLVYELGCRPGKHSSFSKFNQKPVLGIAGPPNGAELAMRFYLKAIMQAYYHQKLSSLETVNVTVDFDFTAPKNADFCLQVHIFKQDDKYHAQIINPKGVTRATLLQKYNGFIYQLKGTSLNVGDEVTAELIVERKEIENQN